MGMFCPLHSLVETVKSTNLDFSNKLCVKMIKGMMTSDFWRVISEVIRGGELLTSDPQSPSNKQQGAISPVIC